MNLKVEGGNGRKRGGRKANGTRTTILATAARHFCEKGYAHTTLKEIAADAGLEASSIYYHFSSKEDLLDDVFDLGCRQVIDVVSSVYNEHEARGANFRETFAAMVYAHLDQVLGGSEFTAAIMRNFSMLSAEAQVRHRRVFGSYGNLWTKAFSNAQKNHEIRSDVSVMTLQQLIVGALNWTTEWFDRKRFSVRAFANNTVILLLDGILDQRSKWNGRMMDGMSIEPMSPKVAGRSKAAQTRLLILLSTTQALRKKGYDGVTLRHIADVAGIEAGSIYYHFSSKEEIIDDVLSRGLNEIVEGVTYILENETAFPDYVGRIAAAIRTHMLYLFVRNDFVAMNIRIYGQLPQDVREKHRPIRQQYTSSWSRTLARAQELGEVRKDVDVVQMRQLMLGALNWSANWFHPNWDDEEDKSLDDLIRNVSTIFLDGIASDVQERNSCES
ncbi:TetR/AcrR family transcriptional regulator [Sneathiella sp. CAU 1612]|uniref:TetR/AcrR family transcriptional regulator n=1 Tax=Sneathiella sedimenti TaxID=2816034 RepID=A0ABS3F487_9PROT|nr:TetR family transcriptional regulator [Sneathiella sedimenti]MBO0333298.1 TetR/AcrR family transcriptional regulator [Sneathiella sedimenti]